MKTMKKVSTRNRYGDPVTFRQLNEHTWLFDVENEHPWGFSASSVDPSGGPLIAVGMSLQKLHPELPALVVTKVGFGVYDTDASGYEYTGCLIHTS
jgi:hypothetical protein